MFLMFQRFIVLVFQHCDVSLTQRFNVLKLNLDVSTWAQLYFDGTISIFEQTYQILSELSIEQSLHWSEIKS